MRQYSALTLTPVPAGAGIAHAFAGVEAARVR